MSFQGYLNVTLCKWKITRHPKCKGYYDAYTGDYDCEYDTKLLCEECKYGIGRKDPEAKCNRSGS